jgi:hypothetical protein
VPALKRDNVDQDVDAWAERGSERARVLAIEDLVVYRAPQILRERTLTTTSGDDCPAQL